MKRFDDQGISYLHSLENSEGIELNSNDRKTIVALLHSKDAETRYLATVTAGLYYDPSFDEPLISLLKDRRLLIRVNACDSLSNSSNINVCKNLLPLMNHSHRLERGFAMLSYSDIVINSGCSKGNAIETLQKRFKVEKDSWVKVAGIEAIAQLGDTEVLNQLYGFLEHKHSRVRRFALKCSVRFLPELNLNTLALTLSKQRQREVDPTIIAEIDTVLSKIID